MNPFSEEDRYTPEYHYQEDILTIAKILKMAKVKFEKVRDTGVILRVQTKWDCFNDDCKK